MTIIHETTNYDKFKFFKRNRETSRRSELKNLLIKYGWLRSAPMTVTKDFGILDGQHRFLIAKSLKMSIPYVIEDNLEEEDISGLQCGIPWKLKDYQHAYVEDGKIIYVKIQKLLDKYKFSLNNFLNIYIKGGSGTSRLKLFKSGNVKLIYEDFDKICEEVKQVKDIVNIIMETILLLEQKKNLLSKQVIAIGNFVRKPGYDHERFMYCLEKYSDKCMNITKFSCSETLQKYLTSLYNTNLKTNKI